MSRVFATFLAFIFFNINCCWAQTSGPSTPEVQKFTPNSVNQMVNLFTGDFNYNIPLLELDGGYPINLSYNSGASMTEEASNVGLGWQLNIGRINRTVRGLPDDFNGDPIIKYLKQEDNYSLGLGLGISKEFFGIGLGLTADFGLALSNSSGMEFETSLGSSIARKIGPLDLSGGLSLGLSSGANGASISANSSLGYRGLTLSGGTKASSLQGIRDASFNLTQSKLFLGTGYYKENNETKSQDAYTNTGISGATFSLYTASTPFTPRIEFPTKTESAAFSLKVGSEVWGLSVGGHILGNYFKQYIERNAISVSGFGYLNLENLGRKDIEAKYSTSNSVYDMASEKEVPVFVEDKNLFLSYLTHDIFSVSAHGLNGSYRAFRTDVGITHHQNQSSNSGNDLGISTEIHGGAFVHAGLNVSPGKVYTYSGGWRGVDLPFIRPIPNNPTIYFKNVGETNGFANEEMLNKLGGFEPLSFKIDETSLTVGPNVQVPKQPEPRNTTFLYLTAEEASYAGIPLNSYTDESKTKINRIDAYRKGHHISYIVITNSEGIRYEFGIAAYNTTQTEVSFKPTTLPTNPFIKIANASDYTDKDASIENEKYYNSSTTPAYAYAYLLTAVYSPDYTDVTNDGPTQDDFGTYTKFNYTRSFEDFSWRTPFEGGYYSEGNLSDDTDDVIRYIYGKKEVWNIHSIETKSTYVRFYNNTPRSDAFSVLNEKKGGRGNQQQVRIDSIAVYSRTDGLTDLTKLVPLKKVIFDYDYTLCLNIPASGNQDREQSGKLTLKRLSFGYGNSYKERHSYYEFTYNNEASYDENAVDRWGNLKKEVSSKFNNVRYPYSEQDKIKADQEAKDWNLSKIVLPTGGEIEVTYEADDYSSVQNKRAMQMYEIVGFCGENTKKTDELFYLDPITKKIISNKKVIIKLNHKIDAKEIDSLYLRGDRTIYFNCILSAGSLSGKSIKEEISGYFKITNNWGIYSENEIWLELKGVDVNPISAALWQKMKKNLNHVLFGEGKVSSTKTTIENIQSVIGAMPGAIENMIKSINGFNYFMAVNDRGRYLDHQHISFARLYNAKGQKIGGGNRVKEIRIQDNWDKMNSNLDTAFYGQAYTYKKDGISSGVATYEPIGSEENPFIVATGEFNNSGVLAPELWYYKTEPFGESLFPTPSIGYSSVTVRNLKYKDPKNLQHHATGFEVNEFYTARDFPTITKRTIKSGIPKTTTIAFLTKENSYVASQGFYIENNDMHGRIKSKKSFSEYDDKTPVSGTEYLYKLDNLNSLSNDVDVVDSENGEIKKKKIGLDFDFYIHTTESSSKTITPSFQFNLDVIPLILGLPTPFITFFPWMTQSSLRFQGITTTKVVYRSGLIDSVISYDNGSVIKTKNLLYDHLSGDVVVTATENEFNQPYYKTKLPAHWFYKGMAPGYTSLDFSLTKIDPKSPDSRLFEGDQLSLYGPNQKWNRGWVYKNDKGEKCIIDDSGSTINTPYDFGKVIRPGKRNMQFASAGEIITKSNPIIDSKKLHFTKVIDASAIEFKDQWMTYYGVQPTYPKARCNCVENDILKGLGSIRLSDDRGIATLEGSTLTVRLSNKCILTIELETSFPICDNIIFTFFDIKTKTIGNFCKEAYSFTGSFQSSCGVEPKGSFRGVSSCNLYSCTITSDDVKNEDGCVSGAGKTINPFLSGLHGVWRPYSSYKYLTDRANDPALTLDDQGTYQNFSLYHRPIATNKLVVNDIKPEEWQAKEYAEIFDSHGRPLEVLNALFIPNSQTFGYGYTLPVASVSNSHYFESGFDSFEDYSFLKTVENKLGECDLPAFFKFKDINNLNQEKPNTTGITDLISHTGRRSLFIVNGTSALMQGIFQEGCTPQFIKQTSETENYILKSCDIVKGFTPIPGKEYIISLWTYRNRALEELDDEDAFIELTFNNLKGDQLTSNFKIKSNGLLIDGWQQMVGSFMVPVGSTGYKLSLAAKFANVCIDDVRIHPFNSNMKSYVYDPRSLRLMATLDEQNFATLYEYDGEGQLTRTKKETEKGIVTLQEIKTAKPKTKVLLNVKEE